MPTGTVAMVCKLAASSTVALAPCWLATTSIPARADTSGRLFSITLLPGMESRAPRVPGRGRDDVLGDGLELHAAASASAVTDRKTTVVRIGRSGEWSGTAGSAQSAAASLDGASEMRHRQARRRPWR